MTEKELRKVALATKPLVDGSSKSIQAFYAAVSPDVVLGLLDKIAKYEALLQEAQYALDYAADMTKPEGLQGCDCPICTTSKNIWKALK